MTRPAQRLQEARERKQMTQAELAEALGVTQSTISRCEHQNWRKMSVDRWEAAAVLLEVPAHRLIGEVVVQSRRTYVEKATLKSTETDGIHPVAG